MKQLLRLCCLALLSICLAACTNAADTSTDTGSTSAVATDNQSTPLPAITASGTFSEYSLPQSNSGMMRPAIDSKGRIWFGEMGRNYLGVFDPRTHTFQQRTPPRGRDGIMGIQVAADDTIWFAEQYANYIGHYLPVTGQYRIYNLPILTTPDPSDAHKMLTLPSAPNDLALDAYGNVWFTELNADSLGRLNPRTGLTKQFPLSNPKSVQKLDPYGVTVDGQGMVWFTESINDKVGRLNPSTGQIRFFTKPGPVNQLMEIAADAHGMLWMTTFNSGLLLSLNTRTGSFTSYYAPYTGNTAGGVYGLAISPDGRSIWVTITAENLLARLDVGANRFIYYHIPTASSLPFGLVMGAASTIWFTEAGSDKVGMLKL